MGLFPVGTAMPKGMLARENGGMAGDLLGVVTVLPVELVGLAGLRFSCRNSDRVGTARPGGVDLSHRSQPISIGFYFYYKGLALGALLR